MHSSSRKKSIALVSRILVHIIAIVFIGIYASNASASKSIEELNKLQARPAPLHEQLLEKKRKQSTVITQHFTDVHPVHFKHNHEAIIPPQCYTKTAGQFNPCYVCHQASHPGRENKMDDDGLQQEYSFSEVGMTNHWKNLFDDRSKQVAAISDEAIDRWINQDNYSALAGRLEKARFEGWIPDLENLHLGAEAFDDEGFAKDGSLWVAFNFKPFPSTFWPTNGSTDDVMIRLSQPFRTDELGNYSSDIYKANLAILEANVKGLDSISTLPVNERHIGEDLNGDGMQTMIDTITRVDRYVGRAKNHFIDTFLYPAGTEFIHTVRYLGVNNNHDITGSTRMKEVRYMKKWSNYAKVAYQRGYELEHFAKEEGSLPSYNLLGGWGLDNGFGWSIQGFIEGHDGELRTLSHEENLFCMGCHTSIGATIDKTFSFPRKMDGAEGWGYINLQGMPDAPNYGETKGEIMTYLSRVGGGGEFRSNDEMFERWFNKDGTLNLQAVEKARDVYELITPSIERARELNKAYKVIVTQQDYIYGRDATVRPPKNVYHHIDNETAPTLPTALLFDWDIRLDWSVQ